MYFLAVLRSTSRLRAISLLFRPACQWTRISMMSTTSKVLLAIGLPPHAPGWEECCSCPDGQVQPDTHPCSPRELRDRAGELRDRYRATGGNFVIVDT